jgi:hypothetical protein
MKEIIVQSFSELLPQFEREKKGHNVVYRGHSDIKFELKTSLGRCMPLKGKSIIQLEKRIMKLFKESSLPYLEFKPNNELEWLAVAQHFGLPTRLLDWTYNPLVAAYFAVENNSPTDSAVFVLSGCKTIQAPDNFILSAQTTIWKYRPPYISSRIQNQSGLFTVHNNPVEIFTHRNLKKIIIPKEIKIEVKEKLLKFGINHRMIYPGLEGVVKDLKWQELKCIS